MVIRAVAPEHKPLRTGDGQPFAKPQRGPFPGVRLSYARSASRESRSLPGLGQVSPALARAKKDHTEFEESLRLSAGSRDLFPGGKIRREGSQECVSAATTHRSPNRTSEEYEGIEAQIRGRSRELSSALTQLLLI